MARVVLFEDDPVVRDLVSRILEMRGHAVDAYEDAADALDSLCWAGVDLLLSDLLMPTPGDQAVAALRAKGVAVPIIIMTGQLDTGRLARLDIQAVVEKPFKLTELMHKVEQVLETSG